MNNNKEGFTLIELLAVIVILAIIALIATPIILGIIDNTKKEAFKASAYGIIDAAEYYYANTILKGTKITEKVFSYPDDEELNYNGKRPVKGTVTLNNQGKVKILIYDGKYCARKEYSENAVTVVESTVEECLPPEPYKDLVLNGSDPVLDEGMIAVTIEADGTVKKADEYTKWYDYQNKKWANSVLVTSSSRSTYQNAEKGTIVQASDILAYFVWIPRYEYETIISTAATEIKVNFIPKTTTIASSNYIIHPAFKFGGVELNGIWVGKFETTGTAASPTIKPGQASLINQNVSTQFKTALVLGNRTLNSNGSITDNIDKTTYGLISESRMMKNTEWGAVAYLTQSKYGRCTNGECVEVSVNTSSSNITGGGTSGAYITNVSQSTTGNITGIYDMNGGAWEYVMGVQYNSGTNTNLTIASSGFTQTQLDNLNKDYCSSYSYGTTDSDQNAYNRAITGDATKETKGWYTDTMYFVYSSSQWFRRGGQYNDASGAGIFSFSRYSGIAVGSYSFRVTIAILIP